MRPNDEFIKLSRQIDLLSLSDDEIKIRGYYRPFLVSEINNNIRMIFSKCDKRIVDILSDISRDELYNKLANDNEGILDLISEISDSRYRNIKVSKQSYLFKLSCIFTNIREMINNKDDNYNKHLQEQLLYNVENLREAKTQKTKLQKKEKQKSLVSGGGQINENPTNTTHPDESPTTIEEFREFITSRTYHFNSNDWVENPDVDE